MIYAVCAIAGCRIFSFAFAFILALVGQCPWMHIKMFMYILYCNYTAKEKKLTVEQNWTEMANSEIKLHGRVWVWVILNAQTVFFLSCECDVNKKRGNHFAHLQPHSVSSSGACVCMFAFVCLLVYGSMRACMSSSTHMQYAFSKHTSEQRIAPQRLMLMKINRPTVVQIALFPPFHLYDFVSVFLVGYFARATNLISLSQIGYFPHT